MFGGSLALQTDATYRSKVFYDTRNVERLSDPERTFVNARIGWTTADEHLEFGIWGRNLFDETNISDIIPIEGLGFDLFSVGAAAHRGRLRPIQLLERQRSRLNAPAEWIGDKPTALQLSVILLVGVCGVMIAGLQPLLLGTLAQEGRITAAQLGHAATAELLLMGAASAYAGGRWKAERLRAIGVVSALALAALNVATLWASGETVTLIRALAGVPSGILIWITIAMIARSPTPERWAGIYLTLQTLAQFVLAAALTAWVISRTGANGGFVALAVLCVISAVAALALPNRFAPLVADSASEQHAERAWIRRAGCNIPVDGVHRRRVGLRGAAVATVRPRADCRWRCSLRVAGVPGARRRGRDAARRTPAMVPGTDVLCGGQRRLPAGIRLAAR